MKQTLQLKLTQHLTLTPQLQQSIRLLQLSTLELNAEVDRMLQENPLLEREEGEDEAPPQEFPLAEHGAGPGHHRAPHARRRRRRRRRRHDRASTPRPRATTCPTSPTSPTTAAADDGDWGGGSGSNEDDDFAPQQVASSSLRDHLMEQLALLNLPLRDRQVVAALIDALDDDGYLASSLEEIADMFSEDDALEPEELTIGLKYLQSFEPAGVGARGPAECLALQLKALPADTPFRAEALKTVDGHLPLLAARDFTKLRRVLHCDEACVQGVRELIRSLNPRPGASFAKDEANYVIPDVVVRKVRNQWAASLNEAAMPKLRLNRIYADILTRNRESSNQQLAAQLQEAKWLIRNVQQRFETILRVAQAIVERQRRFFEHGEVAMRPDGAARDRRHARPARVDDLARDDAEVHADAARHFRAQVLLRQPRRHRHRRRGFGHRDPRADQAAGRRREPAVPADRQPDRRAPGRAGHHRRPPHHRQIPRSAVDSSRQPAQGPLATLACILRWIRSTQCTTARRAR